MVTPGRAILGAIMKSWKSYGHFVKEREREKNDSKYEDSHYVRPLVSSLDFPAG